MFSECSLHVPSTFPECSLNVHCRYAHCLVLSLQNYNKLTRLYPEQHETVLSNILSVYGVESNGEVENDSGKSKMRKEDQAQLPR